MYRTALGLNTNQGDRPRFIGLMPCHKSHNGWFTYRSISQMLVGVYLEWRMPLWLFPIAALSALLIAIVTVSTHLILVARAKPAISLRYE